MIFGTGNFIFPSNLNNIFMLQYKIAHFYFCTAGYGSTPILRSSAFSLFAINIQSFNSWLIIKLSSYFECPHKVQMQK